MDELLHELARAHGIALVYHDIWGQPHRPTPKTLRSLFEAMGIDASSDRAVAERLAETERARRLAVLAPAIVVRSGESPWRIRLQLSEALHTGELRWVLREEHGPVHEHAIDPSTLPQLDEATIDGSRIVTRELTISLSLPPGYHELALLTADETLGAAMFAVVPTRCYMPAALQGHRRIWGIAAQLYSIRSRRNWGMGDFTDLQALVEFWGSRGASVIGLNPLHALYAADSFHCSPYSPNSRLFKQWLYIDVEACAEFERCTRARELVRSTAFQERLQVLRGSQLVDYVGVAAVKRHVLELLYAEFRLSELAEGSARARVFREFQREGGEALRHFALFEALQEHFTDSAAPMRGWQSWPEAYRDPATATVREFAFAHVERIEFFEYLQWLADLQLSAAARRSLELGLGVGIYEDLAVSADSAGAESWANRHALALTASIGAPPDELNLKGQDWGLPPFIPERLRADRYAPFIALLRANMRHSGALRIDHVMALMRLYWTPPGASAVDGVYVHYPFADLLGLVALESQRNRCMLIGEDLGTVPDEVRHGLYAAGVLSYRVVYFERDQSGDFMPPSWYPDQSLVVAATHDLPTVAGWWSGRDVAIRTELDLYPNETVRQAQISARAHDRRRLLAVLAREGRLPAGVSTDPDSLESLPQSVIVALHAYLCSTPAKVLAVQLEDVLGASEQINVPGTVREYPNWQHKLSLDLEDFATDAHVGAMIEALVQVRPRSAD